jgi:hypothetical protein
MRLSAIWRSRLNELEQQNRLLTQALAQKTNDRDEHVRVLTEAATASAREMNQRDEHIRAHQRRYRERTEVERAGRTHSRAYRKRN